MTRTCSHTYLLRQQVRVSQKVRTQKRVLLLLPGFNKGGVCDKKQNKNKFIHMDCKQSDVVQIKIQAQVNSVMPMKKTFQIVIRAPLLSDRCGGKNRK